MTWDRMYIVVCKAGMRKRVAVTKQISHREITFNIKCWPRNWKVISKGVCTKKQYIVIRIGK